MCYKLSKKEKERNQKNIIKQHSIYYNHQHISRMLPQSQVTFNVKDTSPAPDPIPAQEQKKKKLVRKFHSFWIIYHVPVYIDNVFVYLCIHMYYHS